MNRFVIQGEYIKETDDDIFWSDNLGWINFESATIFNTTELSKMNMPLGSVCISYLNKENIIIKRQEITWPTLNDV